MSTNNEEKTLGQVAQSAYDPYVIETAAWDHVAQSVIAEHERRKAASPTFTSEITYPDPNAECKKAFAAGKRIQFTGRDYIEWTTCHAAPGWCDDCEYRVHPDDVEQEIPWIEWRGGECPLKDDEVDQWEYRLENGNAYNWLPPSGRRWENECGESDIIAYRVLKWKDKQEWKLPDPPEGEQYHRTDWTQDMLPEGYRPLHVGETGRYEISNDGKQWRVGLTPQFPTVKASHAFMRTARPLPAKPDPAPVDPYADAKQWLTEGRLQFFAAGMWNDWAPTDDPPCWSIWKPTQFRRRPDPVLVPIGPEDVQCGSGLLDQLKSESWKIQCSVDDGVYAVRAGQPAPGVVTFFPFQYLFSNHIKINRNDGNGWQPCSKEEARP